MGKKSRSAKKGKSNLGKRIQEILDDGRDYKITGATIVDGKCTYSFEVVQGKKAGFTDTVKGTGLVLDDMRNAFAKFNVHLAVLDDAYRLSNINIEDVDQYHSHEITSHYHVDGFKMKGVTGNETIQLTGTKYSVTACGRADIKTTKVALDKLSHYKWWNELKTAADDARREVALYDEGKFTAVEVEEEEENPMQLSIVSGDSENGTSDEKDNSLIDDEFANAAL